ncbi:alpha/beta hydrolase-fold protein [Chryseobacterium indologenes]|uniref:alpha/beta hydrolase n=1 Tax=Chryseobacterium indologenes TaxID=253 RepID=UPI0023E777D8|nr:alpha/beta hydrolase-fold protein [Chryseobacterium indologenes]WET51423.1 alpha/beta hydrolase-fold protein [Chryseobacterium indologenes]
MNKAITLFFLIFITVFTFGQKFSPLYFGEKMVIKSKYVKEKMNVWIKLPEDFEKLKKNCSLLILLDGDEYFGIASNVQNLYQFDDKMPATIVAALPSTIESRWKYYTPTKSKNFSGKKENDKLFESSGNFQHFADFIENEVIRELEAKYKTKFKNKTIFGHSLGGLGVMSFYKFRPQIFENYICASPSLIWDKYMFNSYYENEYPSNSIEKRKIFFSSGNPDSQYYREAVEDLYENMSKKIINSNDFIKYQHYETENHGTSGIRSLIDGLEFIYKTD